MSKHTPGPWRLSSDWRGGTPIKANGLHVQEATGIQRPICCCERLAGNDGTLIAQANARLIAAAPELLDLAYLMLSMLALMRAGEPITPSTVSYMTAKIEAEIAKATGA